VSLRVVCAGVQALGLTGPNLPHPLLPLNDADRELLEAAMRDLDLA